MNEAVEMMCGVKLPDKPSELVTLAKHDLMAVLQNPEYRVDMSAWHSPSSSREGVCLVCQAGAVMAMSLNVSPKLEVTPCGINSHKLFALDKLRRGAVADFVTGVSNSWNATESVRTSPLRNTIRQDYRAFDEGDPEPYLKWLDQVIEFLRKLDL